VLATSSSSLRALASASSALMRATMGRSDFTRRSLAEPNTLRARVSIPSITPLRIRLKGRGQQAHLPAAPVLPYLRSRTGRACLFRFAPDVCSARATVNFAPAPPRPAPASEEPPCSDPCLPPP